MTDNFTRKRAERAVERAIQAGQLIRLPGGRLVEASMSRDRAVEVLNDYYGTSYPAGDSTATERNEP